MGVIPFIRQGVLGVTTLSSLAVLAISANLLPQTEYLGDFPVHSCILGIAVGVISLVTLPVMLVIDNIVRPGPFTSMIVVELAWLSIIWILWGATAIMADFQVTTLCNDEPWTGSVGTAYNNSGMCQQIQAIKALSYLNSAILLLYTGFISVLAVTAANRGQSVWLWSVKKSFGSPAGPVQHPMAQYNVSVPQPQVYHTGTPV